MRIINAEPYYLERLYRSLKPHHLRNQQENSLLGYDSTGKATVIAAGGGITISNGTISSSGGGGTVTSVGLSAPTGLSVSGSPVTTSGTLALSYAAGYSIPTDAKQTDWDTAFGWGDHALAGYATTTYVDNLIDGLKWKPSVKVATTGNITLSGEQTIDGVLTSANRVLVWQQSTPSENGIYVSGAGAWTRAADASTGTELVSAAVNVEAGSTYADIEFVNTNNSINLGVDNITFVTRASTTNHNNLSGLQGGTTNEYYHLTAAEHGVATAPTLTNISSFSTNASKSLYTMTSTIPVEFRTSGASPLLYLDETNARVGINNSSPQSLLDITTNNLGVTQTNTSGIVLANNTAATVGNQQMSPGIRWRGNGWKTTATAGSQTVDFLADVLPVQGTANPTGTWQLKSSVNGGTYTNLLFATSGGFIGIGNGGSSVSPIMYPCGGSSATSVLLTGTGLGFYSYNNDEITSPSVGSFNFVGDAFNATSGTQYNVRNARSFSPTSGTATFASLALIDVLNQTGGANGITRGLYINPTLTSAADFRAIETSVGKVILNHNAIEPTLTLNNSVSSTPLLINSSSSTVAMELQTSLGRRFRILSTTGLTTFEATNTTGFSFNSNVGIGTTSPDRLFHTEVSDAVTNAVTYTSRESHITSGTATTGFGVGKEWELENGSGTNRVAATEEITWSDATNGSEDATYTLKLERAGVLTEAFNVGSGGNITLTSNGGYFVSGSLKIARDASTGADGNIVLSNTAGTSFGLLKFGGTTSSFPSLKRSGTGLVVRLADDSADAPLTASNLLSGTYTPTITSITNIDSASASPAQYMRVGNAVTVSGYVAVDPTAAASTEIAISLPIASNFANDYECAGHAVANGVTNGECAPIYGDSTNNRASMAWETSFTFGNRFYYTFTYQII